MPVINHHSALQKLRQSDLPHYFLLQGKESYLAHEFVNELRAMLKESQKVLDCLEFEEDVDLDELAQAITTFSFENTNRLIICHNIKLSQVISFLERAVPNLYLVVLLADAKVSDNSLSFFKKKGWVISCRSLQGKEFLAWMQDKAEEHGKELPISAAEYLRFLCKQDMAQVSQEIEKAALYLGSEDKLISLEVLQKISNRTVEKSVFELVDAVVAKKREQVVKILESLWAQDSPPVFLAVLLAKHFLQLYEAAALLQEGAAAKDLAKLLKIHPYVGRKLGKQAASFKRARIENILMLLRQLDRGLKTSGGHPQILLEATIAELLEI